MVISLHSLSFFGLKTVPIEIEVDIQTKVSGFEIVGMGNQAVRESVRRIELAIQNSGYHFPGKRIIVNLAPAGIKKVGTLFDLPIALGIISESYDFRGLESCAIVGELSLDGSVRPVAGALPMALEARNLGFRTVLCPAENAGEMALIEGIDIIPVKSLREAVQLLSGEIPLVAATGNASLENNVPVPENSPDMSDIRGQESAKRALEIAAAGGHNALLIGPPGTGKTMLARRLPTILPGLSSEEAMETTMIYSVAGQIDPKAPLLRTRPFRSPHHTASDAAITGGGKFPRPGEVSMAHHGVLFLDEFQQFRSNVLQVLRQPMEDGKITISRAEGSVDFPADFMLVAAMNPSKSSVDIDRWDPSEMKSVLMKVSGPLLDRIDLHVQVPRIPIGEVRKRPAGESSATIRARVLDARRRQCERFTGRGVNSNARMTHRMVEEYCALTPGGEMLLRTAMERFALSIRAYDKILRIARTIADLEGSDRIGDYHLSEALQYRILDRVMAAI